METFLAVLVFMLAVVAMMSVGVMFGRKPIGGSCGGIAALFGQAGCAVCKKKKKNACPVVKKAPEGDLEETEDVV